MKTAEEIVHEARLDFEHLFGEDLGLNKKDEELVAELLHSAIQRATTSFHIWLLGSASYKYLEEYSKETIEKLQNDPSYIRRALESLGEQNQNEE